MPEYAFPSASESLGRKGTYISPKQGVVVLTGIEGLLGLDFERDKTPARQDDIARPSHQFRASISLGYVLELLGSFLAHEQTSRERDAAASFDHAPVPYI